MTKLAMTKSSAAHDRARRARASLHDSVAPHCVATEEAICVRQTKPGAHNRGARATGEFCRNRLRKEMS